MTKPDFAEKEVLRYLACRPREFVEGVISVDESTPFKVELAAIGRKAQSCLGLLDKLPLEIVYECFSNLDILSLLRLSRVCLRARTVVRGLPTFKRVIKHTGHTFQTLQKTRILSLHSVAVLDAALRSDRCASCDSFGPFLFLPSAERCCANCLVENQSLWMMSTAMAHECFALTSEQVQALPTTIRSIPGKYTISNVVVRKRAQYLTSARAAKVAALQYYGSLEDIPVHLPGFPNRKMSLYIHLQQAPLLPLSQEYRSRSNLLARPEDSFGGMGAIPFPSLLDGRVERGLWCRGCEYTWEKHCLEGLEPELLARCVPENVLSHSHFKRMRAMAWTRSEMVEHAKVCLSAEDVISNKWRKGMHERYLSDGSD